jgi:hypothetical protein
MIAHIPCLACRFQWLASSQFVPRKHWLASALSPKACQAWHSEVSKQPNVRGKSCHYTASKISFDCPDIFSSIASFFPPLCTICTSDLVCIVPPMLSGMDLVKSRITASWAVRIDNTISTSALMSLILISCVVSFAISLKVFSRSVYSFFRACRALNLLFIFIFNFNCSASREYSLLAEMELASESRESSSEVSLPSSDASVSVILSK